MKILFVTNWLKIGGAEKLISDIAINMKKQQYDVSVLIFAPLVHEPFQIKLENAHIPVLSIEAENIYNPFLYKKVAPLLKKYDIVHVHLFPALYHVAWAKKNYKLPIKLVYTEHNTTNRRRKNPIFKQLDKKAYAQYNALVSISDAVTESLKKYIGFSEKTHLIENGIPTTDFYIPAEKQTALCDANEIQKNAIKLLQVARFEPAKDQATTIRAVALLPKNINLYLAGDGERLETCKALAKKLNIEDRVIFLGSKSNIPQLLACADIVICSSFWEGFPLTALEAFAAQKPLIASNANGLKQVVEGAGLLFPMQDEKTLAKTILSVINDNTLQQKLIAKGKERVAKYDISQTVKKHIDLYKNLCI